MSTPLELAKEELRSRHADLVIAKRKLKDAAADVETACQLLLKAQAELIVELERPKVRSHRKKGATA